MDNKYLGYCYNCEKEQECYVVAAIKTLTVRGITFNYIEKTAKCKKCDDEVYLPWVNDENAEMRESAFYKAALREAALNS